MSKILENNRRKKYRKFEKSENIWKKRILIFGNLKKLQDFGKILKILNSYVIITIM